MTRFRFALMLGVLALAGCHDAPVGSAQARLNTGFSSNVKPALTGQFPWIVSISTFGDHQCTGSAIAPDLVLTAAHCAEVTLNQALWGQLDLAGTGGRTFALAAATTGYEFAEHDVIVLRVTGEIVGGELQAGVGIPPPYARVPFHYDHQLASAAEVSPEDGFEVAGWGGTSSVLTTFDFDASPPLQMDLACSYTFPASVPEDRYCHQVPFMNGLLRGGDSGGPLTSHPVETGERLLLGVVSSSPAIGADQYDVYADLLGYETPDDTSPATLTHHFWHYLREPQAPQQPGHWAPVSSCSPALSDARGYTTPSWYETIQTADVDGDGDQDFVARQSDGLYWFERQTTGFLEHSAVIPLLDGYGFDYPTYYNSIQAADFDGDGRADIMAMHEGWALTIYRSDPTSANAYSVVPDAVYGEFDDLGFDSLFRAVDLTGDGRIDIVGALLPLFAGVGTARFLLPRM